MKYTATNNVALIQQLFKLIKDSHDNGQANGYMAPENLEKLEHLVKQHTTQLRNPTPDALQNEEVSDDFRSA